MAIRQDGNTYYGLSTDDKPTGAELNGREFKEMDTGKKYLFDAENGEWLEQPNEGGGGGGGGGLVVHQTHDEQTGKYTLDKTWQEIADALLRGPVVRVDHLESDYSRDVSVPVDYVEVYQSEYTVFFTDYSVYATDSADGYPYYLPN